ncbi:MAG: alpha/beta hydrolase [Trueperaceae bacterium]|nr:MAG: alpha/beta hydrolase [Trueperaceae bacterium]
MILVGHSSGSSTVVSYAADHPEDVAKIVLISSIPMSPSEVTREQGGDFSNFVSGDFDTFVQVMVAGVFSEDGTEMHRAALADVMHLSTPDIAVESYWNYIAPDRTPLLAQIAVPTLVVHGAADVNIPVAVSQSIADGVGDATMHVITGKGHAPHITSPDLFNVLMYQFLKN